ncbi:MAG: phage tail sheath subtilisin-like domain-containing protein [Anaerolinea sp.]|nr:phage tail sheath subtilisin-like domain-containing protein [Anaerolinea sp.]
MAVQVSYPGVYIDEFAPGAPIQGVGTSTAAFLGPAKHGPLNEPTKITSWDAFKRTFGDEPLDGFYLWYAARGFFENGGLVCYITRVSNASHDELVLNDRSGGPAPTIRLWAREPGDLTTPIQVTVADAQAVTGAVLFRPTATVSSGAGTAVTTTNAADAVRFRPGDTITVNGVNTTQVSRSEGAVIRVTTPLAVNNGDTLRLTNLTAGDMTFRVANAAALRAGSVIRLTQNGTTENAIVKSVITEVLSAGETTYRVTLTDGLTNGYDLSGGADPISLESFEFNLTAIQGAVSTPYANLSMRPEHPNYYRTIINNDPAGLIYTAPVEPPNVTPAPDNRPAVIADQPLTGGVNDNPTALTPTDYSSALTRLEAIDDVNFIATPDSADLGVQLAVIAHCERMQDRFAIMDSRRGAPLFGTDSVEVQRTSLTTARGYAALYYPWLLTFPAVGTDPILVPPSGHIAGVYARTDNNRGVHKAPAGNEATLSGVLGVEQTMSDIDQGQLNLNDINVIRVFKPGGRPVVWGARTIASDRNWQYVNIRRLFLFLEESIEEGIRWAVFEPNNLQLWQKLKRTITEFLLRVWRDGALFGATPEEAFYVRIDEALNPFSDQALGRLNIEIGVRPTYPAEFIIVRIGIWPGSSEVSEG